MSGKTETEVVIDGKVFYISGYESEEYIQKIVSYLNNKLVEFNQDTGYRRLDRDYQSLFLGINVADDYFKVKEKNALLEDELKTREDDLFNIKHELIATQIKLDNVEKALAQSKDNLNESEKKVIRLETELKEKEKH